MQLPPVTVGIPVFNDPDGLRRTVPSVVGQTWSGPVRVVISDDGSTDETPAVIESLTAVYGSIEVVTSAENRGRAAARNRILDVTQTGYIAWADAGDLWQPRKLELQMATLLDAEQQEPEAPLLCTGPLHWIFTDRDEAMLRVPDVSGDQLRNALTGRLFPYLAALVGRVEHFRDLGGFDERLLRRQDYDLLVRFLGHGGRVVSTPRDVPLYTYLKSDQGRSADEVAAANRILREKHQQYYERYGPALARVIRSQQHRLVARYLSHNGRAAQAGMHRIAARAWQPDVTGTARRAAHRMWPPSRLTRTAARATLRAVRPLTPIMSRPGMVEFARRTGLVRLLSGASGDRAWYDIVKSEVEGSAVTDGGPAATALSGGLRQLEEAAARDELLTPGDWLRLEEGYRRAGLLDSAESALRRGLVQHHDEPDLVVRLIELLPLRKRWADCIEAWSARNARADSVMTGVTHARVARSYRELGNPATALEIARQGLERWPHDRQVWHEVHLSRAELVDWPHALRSAPANNGGSSDSPGVVASLGVLAGDSGPVRGQLQATRLAAEQVAVVVNGATVAASHAAMRPGAPAQFAISCDELLLYLGDGDVLEVRHDGRPLKIDGFGEQVQFDPGHPSRFAELRDKLSSGYVFTKLGLLRPAYTPAVKRQMFALYEQIAGLLHEAYGYRAYPFYGNLLGAIRDHDFIPHDVGGFDVGYVSQRARPEEVRAEFMDLCRRLLERGYFLRVEPWSAYVRAGYRDRAFIDINYAWFNEKDELRFSFGWRSEPVTDQEWFYYPRQCAIGSRLVDVPGNAEAVLEQLYGPSWAVPDQGFELERDVRRDGALLLTRDEMLNIAEFDPDRVELNLDHHPDAHREADS